VVTEAAASFLRGIAAVLGQVVVPTYRLVVCRLAMEALKLVGQLGSWLGVWPRFL
jgi:hypothetical protein